MGGTVALRLRGSIIVVVVAAIELAIDLSVVCPSVGMPSDCMFCVMYSRRSDHTGKEGYPTLAWNVCVAHTTRHEF